MKNSWHRLHGIQFYPSIQRQDKHCHLCTHHNRQLLWAQNQQCSSRLSQSHNHHCSLHNSNSYHNDNDCTSCVTTEYSGAATIVSAGNASAIIPTGNAPAMITAGNSPAIITAGNAPAIASASSTIIAAVNAAVNAAAITTAYISSTSPATSDYSCTTGIVITGTATTAYQPCSDQRRSIVNSATAIFDASQAVTSREGYDGLPWQWWSVTEAANNSFSPRRNLWQGHFLSK